MFVSLACFSAFALQDTALRVQLPSIDPLLEMFGEDAKWDRIRLMRLSPEGGGLIDTRIKWTRRWGLASGI